MAEVVLTVVSSGVTHDIAFLVTSGGGIDSLARGRIDSLDALITQINTQIATLEASPSGGGATILDTSNDTVNTLSSSKIISLLAALKNELLGGAGPAFDTLIELANLIGQVDTEADGLLTLINNCVKFTTQSLSAAQQLQARSNIAAASASDLAAVRQVPLNGAIGQVVGRIGGTGAPYDWIDISGGAAAQKLGVSPQMFGAPQNDLTVDSTLAVQQAVDMAISLRVPLIVDGRYRTFDTISARSTWFAAEGVGATGSGIYLNSTVTGKPVLFVSPISGASGTQPSGYVKNMELSGGRTRPNDLSVGLRLGAMRRFYIDSVYATGLDIGFELTGNCYGTSFNNCLTNGDTVNVGCNLRGSTPLDGGVAGSGSDIVMTNCAWAGHFASLWCGPNAGGYHMFGGFLSGGYTFAAANDFYGSLMFGLSYEPIVLMAAPAAIGDTTITVKNLDGTAGVGTNISSSGVFNIGEVYTPYTSRSGDVVTLKDPLTVALTTNQYVRHVGSLVVCNLHGVSWEGSSRRHAIRGHNNVKGLNLWGCSVNSNGSSNRIISVIKLTLGGTYQIGIYGTGVQGTFTGALPLDLSSSPNFSNYHVEERGTWTSSPSAVTFNGVAMAFGIRPMVSYSGLTRAFASYEDKIFFGGRIQRYTGAVLESSGDGGTTWVAV